MKIAIKRNNDRSLKLVVKKDGAVVDITGWTFRFAVKLKRNDSNDDAMINTLVTASGGDATTGIVKIPINASDTKEKSVGIYYWDILVKDAEGKLQSTATDQFELEQEIADEEA
jgi:hypothetical protein